MGVRVQITNKGLVQRKDQDGVSDSGFSPNVLPVSPLTTAGETMGGGGVYTVSGSAAIGVNLPAEASNAGIDVVVRTASAHAHVLTGSSITDGTDVGTELALAAIEGSSVVLKCDGSQYIVLGSSGSITLS